MLHKAILGVSKWLLGIYEAVDFYFMDPTLPKPSAPYPMMEDECEGFEEAMAEYEIMLAQKRAAYARRRTKTK